MTVRTIVVDGHAAVRGLIVGYLDQDPEIDVVGEARTVAEALQLVRLATPDVMLVNLLAPEILDGLDVVRQVRRAAPETEVVVLASVLAEHSLANAVSEDAIGFVLRDMSPGALRSQVKAAGERRITVPNLGQSTALALTPRHPSDPLTGRETEVLTLLGEGRSNKEIATALSVSEKTVKGHVSAVLAKLGVRSRVQAALFVQQSR